MEYTVVLEQTLTELTEEIKRYLQEGWTLQGGVSISVSESDDFLYTWYAQAMIKTIAHVSSEAQQ